MKFEIILNMQVLKSKLFYGFFLICTYNVFRDTDGTNEN